MTNRAALLARPTTFSTGKCGIDERGIAWARLRHYLDVFIVGKTHDEVRFSSLPFRRQIKDLAGIWERMPGGVSGRRIRVTDRANCWLGPNKELLRMALQARVMFWILGHIGKRGVASPYLIPVIRWEFMTGCAFHLVSFYAMRELRVFDLSGSAHLSWSARLSRCWFWICTTVSNYRRGRPVQGPDRKKAGK